MIKFDADKLSVEIVNLKSCTTALQGSIRIVDEELTKIEGKEVFTKVKVPFSVVRTFQNRHKQSKYLKPVVTAVVKYDGKAIALERHPLGTLGAAEHDGLFGVTKWNCDSEANIRDFVKPLCENNDNWYFDGKFIYAFSSGLEHAVNTGEFLSADGSFRAIDVTTIDLSNLHDNEKLDPAERTCLAFVASSGQYAVTPPIWKNLSDVGNKALNTSGVDDEDRVFQFDAVDQHLAVNLAFALKAGKQVGELFGHVEIEPLQLPSLMIRLKTVNLPKIPKSVKATYDVGMSFTHAMAWLIGMSNRIDTLDSYMVLRSLLKYLTTKGIFRKDIFNKTAIFRRGQDLDSVEHIEKDTALTAAQSLSFEEMMNRMNTGRRNTGTQNIIGGLHGAE